MLRKSVRAPAWMTKAMEERKEKNGNRKKTVTVAAVYARAEDKIVFAPESDAD